MFIIFPKSFNCMWLYICNLWFHVKSERQNNSVIFILCLVKILILVIKETPKWSFCKLFGWWKSESDFKLLQINKVDNTDPVPKLQAQDTDFLDRNVWHVESYFQHFELKWNFFVKSISFLHTYVVSTICTFAKKCWRKISLICSEITQDWSVKPSHIQFHEIFSKKKKEKKRKKRKKLTIEHVSWICLSKSSWQESSICTCEKHSQKIWVSLCLKNMI